MMRNDDACRTYASKVDAELSVPAIAEEFKDSLVAFRRREKDWIAFGVIHNFLHAVTNTHSVTPHVATNNCKNTPCQMVVCNVSHPEATCYRIDATIIGEEIAEGPPIETEEVPDARSKTRVNLAHKICVVELMG